MFHTQRILVQAAGQRRLDAVKRQTIPTERTNSISKKEIPEKLV